MSARFVAVLVAALVLTPAGARADSSPAPVVTPTPVDLPTMPPTVQLNPYVRAGIDLLTGVARRARHDDPNRASGEITYFKRFEMQLRTAPNVYRSVHLHRGTRIDPQGADLAPGDRVAVGGAGRPDGSLDADAVTRTH